MVTTIQRVALPDSDEGFGEYLAERLLGSPQAWLRGVGASDRIVAATVRAVHPLRVPLPGAEVENPAWKGRYKAEGAEAVVYGSAAVLEVSETLVGEPVGAEIRCVWSDAEAGMSGAYPSLRSGRGGVVLLRRPGEDVVEAALGSAEPDAWVPAAPDASAIWEDGDAEIAEALRWYNGWRGHAKAKRLAVAREALDAGSSKTRFQLALAALVELDAEAALAEALASRASEDTTQSLLLRAALFAALSGSKSVAVRALTLSAPALSPLGITLSTDPQDGERVLTGPPPTQPIPPSV